MDSKSAEAFYILLKKRMPFIGHSSTLAAQILLSKAADGLHNYYPEGHSPVDKGLCALTKLVPLLLAHR